MPFVLVLMMKEVKLFTIVISSIAAIISVMVCTVKLGIAGYMTPMLIVYLLLSMISFYDLQRQSYIMFLINQKLRDTLAENERIADEMHASEMRSMIANVAHDLKTVSCHGPVPLTPLCDVIA